MKEYSEANINLAERLCAAYISYKMGIKMDYAFKKYVEGRDNIDPFWCELAENTDMKASLHMANKISGFLSDEN